jgi:hypothetical protein
MYYLVCVVVCTVCVYMCTVLLPPGGYPIAVNKIYHYITTFVDLGRNSSVGIATRYGMDGPGIESRWGGARFSAPV